MGRNIASLIQQIGKREGLTPAQIRVLLAGAKVESGLDPNAVGDGGTSFGLYQMHIGGAGGKTKAEAQRYLDPVAAIQNRARFVREQNITDGAGFAALQRPADPTGYAVKVNAALKGGGAVLNAPVSGGAGGGLGLKEMPSYDALGLLKSARSRLTAAEEDTPDAGVDLAGRTAGLRAKREAYAAQLAAPPELDAPAVSGSPKGGSYKDILAFAGKEFGLQIDGSNQTTGGSHAAGSYHYSGHAVDFGDAKNDPAKLRALATWARANRGRIKEFFYDPLGWYIKDGKIIKGSIGGHGDHVHIAM